MIVALDSPALSGLFTAWTVQPVALALAVAAGTWYARGLRRIKADGRGPGWSGGRTLSFTAGLVLFAWSTNGFAGAYAGSVFWVWSAQMLGLLLIVPALLSAGQPVELARRTAGPQAALPRLVAGRVGRFFANPLVGPAVIPLASLVLFFGPLPGWAIGQPVLRALLPIVVVAVGSLIVLPLIATGDELGSLAVGLALTVGAFELVLDAIPGIILRLRTTIGSNYFDHRAPHRWSITPLHDQQLAGGVLWAVAELIDLPFLVLVYRRWVRADARDAARIDTVLDAERIARGQPVDEHEPQSDEPWWLSDPSMRRRLGGS